MLPVMIFASGSVFNVRIEIYLIILKMGWLQQNYEIAELESKQLLRSKTGQR